MIGGKPKPVIPEKRLKPEDFRREITQHLATLPDDRSRVQYESYVAMVLKKRGLSIKAIATVMQWSTEKTRMRLLSSERGRER